jgi:hypothetical protein
MEKILTRKVVEILGLDKLSVITADMLEEYTSIGEYAFLNCSSLTSITISNSITGIEDFAFWYCTNLTSITLPNSVTSIGDMAFWHCDGLTSVTIPNSVTSIGHGAFRDCHSLTSITIPNNITSIENHAFCGCTSLTSITIGDKTYKNQTAVDGKCKAYKGFSGDMTCRGFQYEKSKTYELDSEPELCAYGFHACLNLTDVFNYYKGKIGKDVIICEVKLEGVNDMHLGSDSKIVAKKITIGKRIL